MNDIQLMDAVERYIRGEMTPEERQQFESLRASSTEVDQLVVEHTQFLEQLKQFGEQKAFRASLHTIHTNLTNEGQIESMKMSGKAKLVYLWKRYKRVTAIAASIAGITALTMSVLVWSVAPKGTNSSVREMGRELEETKDKLKKVEQKQFNQEKAVDQIMNDKRAEAGNRNDIRYKSGGTGFLIDGKGYLVTNAHIIRKSHNIAVGSNNGDEYTAEVVLMDAAKDIAILRITDKRYKPMATLPYGISKASAEMAEPIYTLGYPRRDIVYSEGYLGARTGFNGDTLSCQLGMAVNPGNSGGPVFNHNGEVVGILSTREEEMEGVAFAVQSKFIYDAVEKLKKDTAYQSMKIASRSTVKGLSKQQQVAKIIDYVFFVKGD